ncbi:MAG: G5 domain-containing protein [Clostridia bacterium]|nr:G5 domain-containing protein [Clostridia bacterium]
MRLLNHFMWGEQIGRNKKTALLSAVIFVIAILGVLCNGTSRTVTVFYNNQCTVVSSYFTTPGIILQKAGILLGDHGYDMLDTENGLIMRVGPAFSVQVTADGQTVTADTRVDRVGNLLTRMGIEWDQDDIVTPSADTIVSTATAITLQRVNCVTAVREEAVAPDVIYEDTDTLPVGTQSVKIPGVAGLSQVTYTDRYVDGVLTDSTPVSTVVLEPSSPATVYRGIGAPEKFAPVVTNDAKLNTQLISKLQTNNPIAVNAQGQPLQFKKCIKGKATAYTAAAGKHTATGDVAQVGYIAVDPKEIPYGTMMFIKTVDGSYMYGVAKASDTGGFISGPVDVDLFFNTEAECVQFGVRNVEIYIL